MRDFNGVELEVGDAVAYIDGMAGSSVYLSKGFVKGFTEKTVRVVKDGNKGSWHNNIKPARLTKI